MKLKVTRQFIGIYLINVLIALLSVVGFSQDLVDRQKSIIEFTLSVAIVSGFFVIISCVLYLHEHVSSSFLSLGIWFVIYTIFLWLMGVMKFLRPTNGGALVCVVIVTPVIAIISFVAMSNARKRDYANGLPVLKGDIWWYKTVAVVGLICCIFLCMILQTPAVHWAMPEPVSYEEDTPSPDEVVSENVQGADYIFFRFVDNETYTLNVSSGLSLIVKGKVVEDDLFFDMSVMAFYKVNVDGREVAGGVDPVFELDVEKVNSYERLSVEDTMKFFGEQPLSFDEAPKYENMRFYESDGIFYAAFCDNYKYYVISDTGTYVFNTWNDAINTYG